MYTILQQNPYKMADDIDGVGFKIADEIASKIGIRTDSDFRIRSGILYVLTQASVNGHIYLPNEEREHGVVDLLQLSEFNLDGHLMDMLIDKRIFVKDIDGVQCVYAANLYYTELNVANMLMELNISEKVNEEKLKKKIL